MNPTALRRAARWGRVLHGAALLMAWWGLACGQEPSSSPPPAGAGARVAGAAAEARKVASLSPLASRWIGELGRGDRLVAVDAESAELPGLGRRIRVPVADDEAYLLLTGLEADLVVLPPERIALSQRLNAANVRTVVVIVRDFDDGFTLWGELAARVGRAAEAREKIAAASRPLAAIATETERRPRPKVAVVASFEPLVLVGEDRLASDLVRIAGGDNLTEGRGEAPVPIEREALRALAPALLVHFRPERPDAKEERALAASVADLAPLVVAEFDPERFDAPETAVAARTLRDVLAPLAEALAESPPEVHARPLAPPIEPAQASAPAANGER